MHIHILGIAGTFMGSLAFIAKDLGHTVTGMDEKIYPPMSTQLKAQHINYTQNYIVANLPKADIFIIGNALSRGNLCVEEILNKQYRYTSGAEWLATEVLQNKWVLAVSGTHGKTSTAFMLALILEEAGLNPGFLIGGISKNFSRSSRLTSSPFFVIEADEYDTAFFDKRSKFIHYRPKTLIINNLEFDHADIFNSLADIQKQFNHLIRTIPSNGIIIYPENQLNIQQIFAKELWTKTKIIPIPKLTTNKTTTEFAINKHNKVTWKLLGEHNMKNALCAVHAAHHLGVSFNIACKALEKFQGVKKRLEIKYKNSKITLYQDFAHHHSAIKTTIAGLRYLVGLESIIIILELRSNTMKLGIHKHKLVASLKNADQVLVLKPKNIDWDIVKLFADNKKISLFNTASAIVAKIAQIKFGHLVIMSNGNFYNIHNKIIKLLKNNQQNKF